MKYIVLDPISNTEPRSLFAKSRYFNKEIILKELHKQAIVKLFSSEEQALHYARSLSKKARPPKASGRVAPIIECELDIPVKCNQKNESCLAPDGDPDITKVNLVKMSITYSELPIQYVQDDALIKVFFPKESMPDIDLRHRVWPCAAL